MLGRYLRDLGGVAALLVLAVAGGCASRQPPRAQSSAPEVSTAAAAAPLPDDACGLYASEDHSLVLGTERGRLLLLAGDAAFAMRTEPSARGMLIQFPLRVPGNRETDAAAERVRNDFPETLELFRDGADGHGWKLDHAADGSLLEQRTDKWAQRLAADLSGRQLRHVDVRGVQQSLSIRQALHLLRNPSPAELAELKANLDPNSLKLEGGITGYVAKSLWLEIDALRPLVSSGETVSFERYVAQAHSAATEPLWPPAEDALLFEMAQRAFYSSEVIRFGSHALIELTRPEAGGGVHSECGFFVPDPTDNHERPWVPFEPPKRGKLGKYTHIAFMLHSAREHACSVLPAAETFTRPRGAYYFRLFADADAHVRGAQFVGYMLSELFVAQGTSQSALFEMLGANQSELERQAE